MKGALIVLGFLATSFLIPLLQDEVKEVLPWLAERLVRRAARRMPEEVRDDYANEWVAELYGKPGRIAKLWFAAKIARGAGKTGREELGLPPAWQRSARRAVGAFVRFCIKARYDRRLFLPTWLDDLTGSRRERMRRSRQRDSEWRLDLPIEPGDEPAVDDRDGVPLITTSEEVDEVDIGIYDI
jgi:hypothetical protein